MLMKATKFCNQKYYFLTIFVPLMTGWNINWYNYVQKAPGQYPKKKKAPVKELVVDNSTNNSSSNINKISVFGKGKYCLFYFSRTQKIVKLNITTQIKELWLLALNLAKKNFWAFKEISNLSFFCTSIQILSTSSFDTSMLPLSQTYFFRVF